uniref:lens fiber membrane intrinsic protein-like n=1 Tax=Oncorhynchus gorbuscha TaxID=8017 RepID=UPI001EAEC295|nr:lens fiber membrane intrinsic protein-like [Oncorhynchus gorbuscha]
MYSFMGGGLFCAGVGNILLIVSTATDYWMQYRHSNNYMHQGLWRYCMPGKCFTHNGSIAHLDATRALMILSLLTCFIGIIIGIMAFIHSSFFNRFDKTFAAGILFFISCFFVLLAMAVYTGVTINYYGKRYGNWRFSWSFIIGWVSVVLNFFSGIFYMCAYRMHECPRNSNSH